MLITLGKRKNEIVRFFFAAYKSIAMPRLIDRNRQIPNNLTFYQPETGWRPRPYSSFNGIVQALVMHRQANGYLAAKHGWELDPIKVANEVDEFNALLCQKMGWTEYITQGAGGRPSPPPFPHPPMPVIGKLGRLAAGAKVIVDWIASGEEAVPGDLAEKRAAICAGCIANEPGDWTRFFTVPASEAIRRELSRRRDWKLSTSQDAKLNVCTACWCPLPLKVHMPIDRVMSKLDPEAKAALVPNCWIRSEGHLE